MERGRVSYTNGETIASGDSLYRGYSEVVPGSYRGNLNVAGKISGEI